jgi:hypothetical protein
LQLQNAFAMHEGIGVQNAQIDPFDSSRDDGLGAGRSFPLMGAGFQRYIHIRAPGIFPSLGKSLDLGVVAAVTLGPAFSYHFAVFYDHGSHKGVWRTGPARFFSGSDGQFHPFDLFSLGSVQGF